MSPSRVQHEDKILIVGAGCFGISTAYHLLKRGFTNVTVIDRSDVLPAPDAAGTDMNKIVRTSYSDYFYSRLAHDAIAAWKKVDEWGDCYQESGVLVLGSGGTSYATQSYLNDVALGSRIKLLENAESIHAVFPSDVRTGAFENYQGYLNLDGGWARAADGVSRMTAAVVALGGRVISGKPAVGLLKEGQKVTGVRCSNGEEINADLVVIAAGSWTASSFTELNVGHECLATGQSVVTIQLTAEEAANYRRCPVVLDFASGFYAFPPTDKNVFKMAIDHAGYTNYLPDDATPEKSTSTPRTILSHGSEDGLRIPRKMVTLLRHHLSLVYPDLAKKPFASTRLCWYTDSPDGDWIIGPHPSIEGLVLATAGSGHAYKFLPVLGQLVADSIEGKLAPEIARKFALGRQYVESSYSRRSGHMDLEDLSAQELCEPKDLAAESS
ncbi:FAD dependent oxidoreductase [Dentipellis sp. KUC8613]|nr:FAD dependent oxidoreductase [Dentipellis sp. KUC8613]